MLYLRLKSKEIITKRYNVSSFEITGVHMRSSEIKFIQFESKSLIGNFLNDPHERNIPVYLPPDYDESKEYPSVYLLSGFSSRSQKY